MKNIPTINIPQTYTEEVWARTGNLFNKQYIGLPYISWSQIESFNDKTGFNTGLLGQYEYLLKYFCKKEFPEMGWGVFGGEAEAYITIRNTNPADWDPKTAQSLRDCLVNFNDKEKKILEQIEPLGVFQDEICYHITELNIIVLGYIDDRHPEDATGKVKLLRDYKTKSESSKKDLHLDKKHQIELYVLGLRQRDIFVQSAEYCIIERLGGKACMDGGGRESLSIGERIWYEPYAWTEERLQQTHQMVIDTVTQISSLYSTYQKFFQN